MSEDLNQKGLEIRREVLGKEYVDKSIEASASVDFGMPSTGVGEQVLAGPRFGAVRACPARRAAC